MSSRVQRGVCLGEEANELPHTICPSPFSPTPGKPSATILIGDGNPLERKGIEFVASEEIKEIVFKKSASSASLSPLNSPRRLFDNQSPLGGRRHSECAISDEDSHSLSSPQPSPRMAYNYIPESLRSQVDTKAMVPRKDMLLREDAFQRGISIPAPWGNGLCSVVCGITPPVRHASPLLTDEYNTDDDGTTLDDILYS